jgi:hypothetical protein
MTPILGEEMTRMLCELLAGTDLELLQPTPI